MIEFRESVKSAEWTVSFCPVKQCLRVRAGDKTWLSMELPVSIQRELFADLGHSLARHGDSISNARKRHD